MIIKTVKQLQSFVAKLPSDAKVTFICTYSEDINCGEMEIDYDKKSQELYFIGSEECM